MQSAYQGSASHAARKVPFPVINQRVYFLAFCHTRFPPSRLPFQWFRAEWACPHGVPGPARLLHECVRLHTEESEQFPLLNLRQISILLASKGKSLPGTYFPEEVFGIDFPLPLEPRPRAAPLGAV